MYRNDKQFMTNRDTANCRVYVGSLPKGVVSQDLEEKFGAHGNILGMTIQVGFAFIQYETEEQAENAIRAEHQSVLMGRKITVQPAINSRPGGGFGGSGGGGQLQSMPPPQQQGPGSRPPLMTSPNSGNSPMRGGMQQGPPRFPMQGRGGGGPPGRGGGGGPPGRGGGMNRSGSGAPGILGMAPGRGGGGGGPPYRGGGGIGGPGGRQQPPSMFPPNRGGGGGGPPPLMSLMGTDAMCGPPGDKRQGPLLMDRGMDNRHMRPGESRFQPSRDEFFDERRDGGGGGGRGMFMGGGGGGGGGGPLMGRMPPGRMDMPPARIERIDCEIVVVSKSLAKFAEYIEQRLKSVGLLVDLLFPNEDVPIGRALADISGRGGLYAILLMPQNEENRSLTLVVLHGVVQEHRNMPLEDAILFVKRNFDAYMRGDKVTLEKMPGQMVLSDRHPPSMQTLLNLLVENRQLSTGQYDRLFKYLQERRELQLQHEQAEGIVDEDTQQEAHKQAELQNRILNILNKSGPNEMGGGAIVQSGGIEQQSPVNNNVVASSVASGGSGGGANLFPVGEMMGNSNSNLVDVMASNEGANVDEDNAMMGGNHPDIVGHDMDLSSTNNDDNDEIMQMQQQQQQQLDPAGPPLLKDPSVQKALDSLMGGDMFKSMAAV